LLISPGTWGAGIEFQIPWGKLGLFNKRSGAPELRQGGLVCAQEKEGISHFLTIYK
jgi:hypothetical protein